jgi:hypothetical protein
MKLPLIQLRDGQWICGENNKLFFPADSESWEIPGGISLLVVDQRWPRTFLAHTCSASSASRTSRSTALPSSSSQTTATDPLIPTAYLERTSSHICIFSTPSDGEISTASHSGLLRSLMVELSDQPFTSTTLMLSIRLRSSSPTTGRSFSSSIHIIKRRTRRIQAAGSPGSRVT